jgi:hypothetical protein
MEAGIGVQTEVRGESIAVNMECEPSTNRPMKGNTVWQTLLYTWS